MKKNIIAKVLCMALTGALVIGSMTGCGKSASNEAPAENSAAETSEAPAEESTDTSADASADTSDDANADTEADNTTAAGDVETVGKANPWVEITEEEANELCIRLFKAPEGAQDQVWSKCEELGDEETGVGPLVQLSFSLDGRNFTARAQYGAAEDADIAGNYVDWTVGPEEAKLANWGGGNMIGKTYRSINDTGYVDMITWYDVEIGIAYSLSVADEDLDGFDIQAIAEQMYSEENDAFNNAPSDFLQDETGILSFDSYDDVIAALSKGEGYAYIKLAGVDDEFLAITPLVFEADNSAYEVSIYGKFDGTITQLANIYGNGSAYPVRYEDGILYAGDNHTYETYFASKEYGSVMPKDYISDGVATGTDEITGFTREVNNFEDTTDYTGTLEDFQKLLEEREKKPIVEFTVVE